MDPDAINYEILRIHVGKNNYDKIPSHAIQRRTSVSARYGSKKQTIFASVCVGHDWEDNSTTV